MTDSDTNQISSIQTCSFGKLPMAMFTIIGASNPGDILVELSAARPVGLSYCCDHTVVIMGGSDHYVKYDTTLPMLTWPKPDQTCRRACLNDNVGNDLPGPSKSVPELSIFKYAHPGDSYTDVINSSPQHA